MKVYRILYRREIVEQMEIPVSDVYEVHAGNGALQIVGQEDETLVVVPHHALVGMGIVEKPEAEYQGPPAPPVESVGSTD